MLKNRGSLMSVNLVVTCSSRALGKLLGSNTDSAFDVYGARECTSASPCLPPVLVQSPACVSVDACRAAPVPRPSIFGAPASAMFSGAGNVTPRVLVPSKPVVLTRAQKLAVALKVCRKDKKHSKRRVCERQAHKRFSKRSRSH